jgi:hypothetical protein
MFTRKSGILALVLGALVLGACEDDDTIIQPTPAPTITIAPSPVPAINTGSTFQLLAVTTNLPTGSVVTWASSNNAIATVDANGLVRCLTAGNVLITGTIAATANTPQAQNAVAITCQVGTTTPPPGTPTVSISRITEGATGLDVNPGNVSGVVNVVMNVDVPAGVTATAARVMVGNTEVCRTGFSGGTASEDAAASVPVTVVCSFNTAQLNAAGAPLFPNGTYQIRAEVLNGTTVIAASTSRTLVFNNVDALIVSATASGASATDNAGLVWRTGDLTVTVAPSIFSGAAVTSGVVTVTDANTGAVIAQAPLGTAAANGSYSVTFTKAPNTTNGLLDVSEAESPINVTVTTVAGGNPGVGFGPAQPGANPLRLDNDAPDDEDPVNDATFINPGWFSTTTSLATSARIANFGALTDEGVNRNTVRYEYNTSGDVTSTTGWVAFTDISALPETTTSTQLAFRAVVCDQLANCTPIPAVLSGVDRSVPEAIVNTGPSNNAINPATNLNIIGRDVISGASIVRVRTTGRSVFEIDANADVDVRCYDAAGNLTATNPTANGGVCPTTDMATAAGPGASETNATVVIPADENWYTIEIQTVDVAGNVSTTLITRNYLRDAEVPTATIASTTITGTNTSISGTVQDNIQVQAYDSRFLFTGAVPNADEIPFSSMTTVDATLDNALTGQAAASASSSSVVRALQVRTGAGVFGAAIFPTQYGFGVLDMANLFGFNGAAISFGGTTNGVANTADVALTASPGTICRTGTTAACTNTANTSTTLTTTVTTTAPATPTTPFNNPIARVYYYYTHRGSDATLGTADDYLVLIGSVDASAATFTTSSATGVRTFVFNTSLAAASLPGVSGAQPVHAIAVDAEGDAILTSSTIVVQ